jgi:hypothetical protein
MPQVPAYAATQWSGIVFLYLHSGSALWIFVLLLRLTELNLSHLTLSEQALTALSGPAAVPSLKILVLDDVALTGTVGHWVENPS